MVAAAVGVVVAVGAGVLFRVPAPEVRSLPKNPAPGAASRRAGSQPIRLNRVSADGADPLAGDDGMLFDPTPLFLPTRWNSSRKDAVLSEPGGAFGGYPAKLTFAESDLALPLPKPVEVPASPAAALRDDPPTAPFLGFNRPDSVVVPVGARGGFVEIVDAATGRPVFQRSLADAKPPVATEAAWPPLEFLAAVDAAGLFGPLVSVPLAATPKDAAVGVGGSVSQAGLADLEAYFREYLVQSLHIGERLAPGFYRITVGP